MSKRKQLVEKIIREEMTGYAKKILDERKDTGMHWNGSAPLPEPEPNRAIAPNKKRSTVTSIVDEPNLNRHFVEEKFSDRLEEEASESDSKDYGVNTTSAAPAGGDDTGKIEHVPGYPLDSDMDVQSEVTFRRWKQLALMGEGVDDAEFEAELETLAPRGSVGPETDMEGIPPETPDIDIEASAGPGGDLPIPDTSGRLDTLGGELDTAIAGAETDMGDIEAPGGGNLMDMSKEIFKDFEGPGGSAGMIPGSEMFDVSALAPPPMDMGSELDMQADQLETAPTPLQEAIRRVLKEKLLT